MKMKDMAMRWLVLGAAVALMAAPVAAEEREVRVPGSTGWLDTGILLNPGDQVAMSATGTVRYAGGSTGPEGLKRGWMDLLRVLPFNDAGRGALLGRVGETARPFLIGAARQSRTPVTGKLYLGINQSSRETASGEFVVSLRITRSAEAVPKIDPERLPQLTQEQLDQLPLRVADADGTPGDRVNFLVIGTETQVEEVLEAAGWVQVNRSVQDALIQGALATFSRQAYTQLPMSELYLFGRPQDFGFAQADPLVVVAARHHFRLWKAPFTVDGETLWVGAGTHDIGFEKDQRNGRITHKIDPDTDKERDYIGESLRSTGMVASISHLTPANPVTQARTAHGASFHSDGRTLIITLRPDHRDRSVEFSNLFCSVLEQNNPDGGRWGECGQYLETKPDGRVELGPISNDYRVLVVPGLMNTCFRGAPAYREGRDYLERSFGMTAEILSVPNDSSEDNAKQIAAYLKEKMAGDKRKYIVLGYSKGAPDLQVALAQEPGVKDAVAAFISVAGAVGGSPIADTIPGMAERWIRQYGLPNCEGDLSAGFRSLSQRVRRAFLATYPDPIVPSYSLPAYSVAENTSTMLQQSWRMMSAMARKQDSQLTVRDAMIPGSVYLGSALGDHFAVALPFESSDEQIKRMADKNTYPRSALLEAMVRFVIADLERGK
ncbi:MAG: LssY C-terminal domain-containing protein [Bryobacterales bacterium]|nr:LssY C-terminal domain-containing protein [Bryobacterales bacterium]